MTRFIPRAQSAIVQGQREPVDPTWYHYLRTLGIDLDALQTEADADVAALATHAGLWPAHGWSVLADKALTVGLNTIVHGLGRVPDGVIPYASDAGGYAGGYCEVTKNGDQALASANAWNRITGWTELADPDNCFSDGLWASPRTGIYSFDTLTVFDSVADGGLLSTVLRRSDGVISTPKWLNGTAQAARIPAAWKTTVARGATVSFEAYRETAARSVLTGAAGAVCTYFSVFPEQNVNCYSFDSTNLYGHSDYADTRSFLVR